MKTLFTIAHAMEHWGIARQVVSRRAKARGVGSMIDGPKGPMMVFTAEEFRKLAPRPVGRPMGFKPEPKRKDAVARARRSE